MAKTNKSKPTPRIQRKPTASGSLTGKLDRINNFLEKHNRKVVGILLGLSLIISAIYYAQAWNGPITSYYKWKNSDMAFFDEWAKYIKGNDWACDTSLHPYHDWHGDLATEYFRQFPDVESKYVTQRDSTGMENAKRALINDIYKGKTYHQEPLYTYMLAITYSIFGEGHQVVFIWQFLMAAFTIGLIYLIGRKMFSPLIGLLAALFVLLNGAITVFEMVLLRTTMTNFFTVLLLYLFLLVLESPTLKRNIVFGIASGIAVLSQSILILFIVPAWIWLLWQQRKEIKSSIPTLAANVGAFLLVLTPLFIRNLSVGVPITATASQGAMAYIPMNIQETYPMESFFVHLPTLAKIRHDTGGKMLKAVGACLETFDNFKSFWRVYSQKINGMFMWYEIPNNVNFYLFREIAPVLKFLPVSYFLIAPMGLAGLLLGLYRLRTKLIPVVLMVLVSMAPMMIAGNLARYRTPLVILFSILAAYFLIEMISLIANKKMKIAGIALGVFVLLFIYTATTVRSDKFLFIGADLDTFYREHYLPKLESVEAAGDFPGYLNVCEEMADDIPDYFFEVPRSQPINQSNEAECSRHVTLFLESYFNILTYLKKEKEAAYIKDRISILTERMNEFNQKLGK